VKPHLADGLLVKKNQTGSNPRLQRHSSSLNEFQQEASLGSLPGKDAFMRATDCALKPEPTSAAASSLLSRQWSLPTLWC
jgi:hypothetical protein